jgi:two-component system, NtrC family, sensor kinase
MTNTIVGKLTVFVGVLVGVNTAMLIGAAYVTTSSILSDQVRDRLEAIAGDRQEILLQALQQQQERASRLAGRAPIRALFARYAGGTMTASQFAEEAGGFLSNVQVHAAGLLALWAEDAPGRIIAASDPDGVVADLARAERTSAEPSTGGGLVVPPRRVLGTYAAVFAGVVRDDDGRVLGTLLLAADLGLVMAFLADTHGLGDHGEVMVGWKSGDRIHLPLPPRGKPELAEVPAREFPSLDAAATGHYGFIPATDYRDRDVLVAYKPLGIGYPDWGLLAKVDKEEAYEPVARLRWLLLVLGGGLLALGLGASNAIARRFARPIKRLARTSDAVAAGDLTVRSEVTSSDEIGRLSLAFNRMTEELGRSYGDLERRIAERTHALESVRDLLDAFFRIFT